MIRTGFALAAILAVAVISSACRREAVPEPMGFGGASIPSQTIVSE
jgi:hypothetical protein